MSPLWMVPIQLVIIGGGVLAALTIGRPQAPGRHRLPKRVPADEMAEIEEWLAAMQDDRHGARRRQPVELSKPIVTVDQHSVTRPENQENA